MTKAKARERAKKRAAAKAARPPGAGKGEKGAQHDDKVRPGQQDARGPAPARNKFGPDQHIKSAARTTRGAARSR